MANEGKSGDLDEMVTPLIRDCTWFRALERAEPPSESRFESHFGGQPYFEDGEQWPTDAAGRPLQFICQVVNAPGLELPPAIQLVQFYFNWDLFPYESGDDGWLLKVYRNIRPEQAAVIPQPDELEATPFCHIEFEPARSLPTWEGLEALSPDAKRTSIAAHSDYPSDPYDRCCDRLIGERNLGSQLGGYPNWVQADDTPCTPSGARLPFLLQLDSEQAAGLTFGDVGSVYLFFDPENDASGYVLQCY